MDEVGLIEDAKRGDLDAFNRLVLAYQDLAYSTAYRLVGDPDVATDTTQTAFISAYRKLRDFRGGSFRAWILRIVTNASYDELRRQKRQPTISLDLFTQDGDEVESPHWLQDPGESPENHMVRMELGEAIQHCLNGLAAEFRAVVVMVDVQGLDYTEAARVLRRPVGTVKSRLARARLRLQECLQAFGELLPSVFRLEDEA